MPQNEHEILYEDIIDNEWGKTCEVVADKVLRCIHMDCVKGEVVLLAQRYAMMECRNMVEDWCKETCEVVLSNSIWTDMATDMVLEKIAALDQTASLMGEDSFPDCFVDDPVFLREVAYFCVVFDVADRAVDKFWNKRKEYIMRNLL